MQNKKDQILNHIKEIDQSVHSLSTQKSILNDEIKEIEKEEKRQKLIIAISSNPIDWNTVMAVDNLENPLPGAVEFITDYLKDYSKNVKLKGHYTQSMQLGMHFLLGNSINADQFVIKMAPILRTLKPVTWKDGQSPEVAIPIIDKKNGTTGSYSLLINSQKLGRIVKVSGNKVEFQTKYISLKQAIEWAQKNCNYYG